MLELPNVTLICVDCLNVTAAMVAMRRSLEKCRFARAVLVTHEMPAEVDERVEVALVPQITSREAYSRFMLNELGRFFATSHLLVIQWDGYVVNPGGWNDEFLGYDYIGAKWWHKDGRNVGNGGFSLRSRKLIDAVKALDLGDCTRNEDDVICRENRLVLEQRFGIRFASEEVADSFAFERGEVSGDKLPFGFHGLFNMGRFLSPTDLEQLLGMLHPRVIAYVEMLELAQQYLRAKRNAESILVATRVLDLNPGNMPALKMLCVAAVHSSRRWLAVQALKELQRIEPRNPEHTANLGDLAASTGNFVEAAQQYRRVLQLRPNDAVTIAKLQQLGRKTGVAA